MSIRSSFPRWGAGKHIKIRVEPDTAEIDNLSMQQAVKKFIETVKYRITITPDVEITEIGETAAF